MSNPKPTQLDPFHFPSVQKKPEGYLMVDHRASPGIPEAQARRMGYDPATVAEGKLLEAAMLHCSHCNQPVMKNPLRTRPRASCMKCAGNYICDNCDLERTMPDYVHRSFREIVDLVATGKVTPVTLGVRSVLQPTKRKEY